MNIEQRLKGVRPCLRFLMNEFVDWEIARSLLDTMDMETVVTLQAVLIVGMESMERLDFTPAEDPDNLITSTLQRISFDKDEPEQEKAYLLQPEYRKYLKWGMHVLRLD